MAISFAFMSAKVGVCSVKHMQYLSVILKQLLCKARMVDDAVADEQPALS